MKTDAEILDAITENIYLILTTGQSVSSTGDTLTHANLDQLYAMQKAYESRVNNAAGTTGRNKVKYGVSR